MTTMMRFAFAPDRIDAIRGLLSDLPATRALRNAFCTAEGITDPVRHGDPNVWREVGASTMELGLRHMYGGVASTKRTGCARSSLVPGDDHAHRSQ